MDSVLEKIKEISLRYEIDKIVLFGSRARGDHSHVSDYDIAIYEDHMSALDKARLRDDIDEIETLKKIDIIFVHEKFSDELMENIKRDGVTLYE